MPLNLPTLYKRTGSAIVYAAIMLTALLWKDWLFAILVCVINFLCLREYFRLLRIIDKETYWPAWIPAAMHAVGPLAIGIGFILVFCFDKAHYFMFAAGLLPAFLLIVPLVLSASLVAKQTSFFALAQAFTGVFYITLSLLLLLLLRVSFGFIIPLAMIVMIWINDSAAYFVGSFIGKTPFSPISPKKTWEGTIGGGVVTIAGALVYGFFSHIYRVADWVAIAVIVSIAGPVGDLMKSKLKRIAGVKDSGNLMPGHGGALDRFDSILMTAPFVFAYTYYFIR